MYAEADMSNQSHQHQLLFRKYRKFYSKKTMTDEEIIYPAFGSVVKNPFRETNFVKESYDGYREYPHETNKEQRHYGLIMAIVLIILMQLL